MFKKIIFFGGIICSVFWGRLAFSTPTVHIYIDFATMPALMQMVDFIKVPKHDKKFIFWRRFPNLNNRINLSEYNAIQIDLPKSESKSKNKESFDIVTKSIKKIYDNNPDANYVIHSNLWWNSLLIPILRTIPRNQVKHIHIYEDGLSNVVHSRKKHTISVNPDNNYKTNLELILNGKIEYTHKYDFAFHTLYPVRYYFGFVDYMKKYNEFNVFINFISPENIQEIDWIRLSHSLTEDQKEVLYLLVGFDRQDYQLKTKDKMVDFFLLRGASTKVEEQIKTAETLLNSHDKNRILILKEHPSLVKHNISQKIKEKIPHALIFSKQIPFEILILADLMPDTVSGYTTSVFFSVPKERIKYYITSERDSYLSFLKELNIVTDEQVVQSIKEKK